MGGPATKQVTLILREGNAAIATANLVEALDVSQRVRGLPIDRALAILYPLFEEALLAVPLDVAVAGRAATIRARHYHRSRCPISLADAVLIASADRDDRIATADPYVLAVASTEQHATVELPGEG